MTRYNIYRRKDGRWEGRIPRGKKSNGKRKFKYSNFPHPNTK